MKRQNLKPKRKTKRFSARTDDTLKQYQSSLKSIMESKDLKRGQKNRRAKQIIRGMTDVATAKAATIKAIGMATAQNTVAPATAIGTSMTSKAIINANNLINAGATNADKNNVTDKYPENNNSGDERE